MKETIQRMQGVEDRQNAEDNQEGGRPDPRDLYMGRVTRYWWYRGFGEPDRTSTDQAQNSADGKNFFGSTSDERNGSTAYNYGVRKP